MKVLVMTNTPGHSVGYSTLAKYLLPHFKKFLGEGNLRLAANYGVDGEAMQYLESLPGIPVYGSGEGGFNEASFLKYYQHFEANIFLTIWDIWALNHIPSFAEKGYMTLVPYLPIDTEDASEDMIRACRSAFRIIPMGKHTENVIKKYFPNKVYSTIPCGLNTNIYRPLWNNLEEKAKWRKGLGFNSSFVIGLAGDIKGERKSWPENLEGVALFRERNPNIKFNVFVHTKLKRSSGADFDIETCLEKFKLNDITRETNPLKYSIGTSESELAEIYNGADVFLQCSRGEGFGMMHVEAQSCGTPVIGTDFSNTPFVIGKDSGSLVKPIMKVMRQNHERQAIPSPVGIAEQLEYWYNRLDTEKEYLIVRDSGKEFASQFDWEKVYPMWDKAFEQLTIDLKKECLTPPEPSELMKKRSEKLMLIENV